MEYYAYVSVHENGLKVNLLHSLPSKLPVLKMSECTSRDCVCRSGTPPPPAPVPVVCDCLFAENEGNSAEGHPFSKKRKLDDDDRKKSAEPEEEKCPVCLSSLWLVGEAEVPVVKLSCGHKFHKNCIDQWRSKNATCPLCRAETDLPAFDMAVETFVDFSGEEAEGVECLISLKLPDEMRKDNCFHTDLLDDVKKGKNVLFSKLLHAVADATKNEHHMFQAEKHGKGGIAVHFAEPKFINRNLNDWETERISLQLFMPCPDIDKVPKEKKIDESNSLIAQTIANIFQIFFYHVDEHFSVHSKKKSVADFFVYLNKDVADPKFWYEGLPRESLTYSTKLVRFKNRGLVRT